MTKRFLLPGFLFFFLCFYVCSAANAQDTTKKAEPEKRVEPEQKAAATTTTAPQVAKPLYRRHRISPIVNPPATTVTNAQPVTAVQPDLKTQADPAQLNAKTLNGQYQYMLTKALPFQQPLLGALWKNVTDSLNKARNDSKALEAKLNGDAKLIDSLKTAVANTTKELGSSQASVQSDTISMFGIVLSKSTYNIVMFSLVIGLAIAFTVVVLTTAKHKYEAKHRTELYEEIEEEFKTYKAKANEKELRLARELQTERNKLDELLGRG